MFENTFPSTSSDVLSSSLCFVFVFRVAVKTALDKWETKFESTPKGQQARGGGPWLR